MLSPSSRPVVSLCALTAAILLAAAPLPGADLPTAPKPTPSIPKAPPKEIELETEVDLIKLLRSSMVFATPDQLNDTIWQVTPSEGRTILRIPISVTKPDSEVIVSGAAVKLRGGRFICWQLIDPSEEVTGKTTPLAAGATIRGSTDDALPPGVPRMTRSVRLDTDGRIHWKMDRAIPGATIIESTPGPYNLKLAPKLVDAINPGNPPRTLKNDGEKPADFLKRKSEADAQYREKSALYRETRQMLLKLPDEFSGPLPPTLWAVYEARANAKTIEFDGPAPLPWDIPFELLQQLQRVMNATADGKLPETSTQLGQTGTTFTTTPVEQIILKELGQPKVHPYTIRLIAHAITLSPYLSNMEEGDSKYQIVEKVLAAKDSTATGEVMKYLAVRPSKASAGLMGKALQEGLLDAKAQLGSVLGMVNTLAGSDAASIDSVLQTINRYLADAKGPAASQILSPLFELARTKPALADPIAKGLRVDAAGARRDEIILALVTAAVTDPVAMAALDAKLLGSDDQALVERTLFIISRAERATIGLTFKDAADKPIDLRPAPGVEARRVVLAYWSTAMPQPIETLALLSKLSDAYAGQGVRFITINLDGDKAKYENFAKEIKLALPTAHDEKGLESELARRAAVVQLPEVVMTNAAGDIQWRGRPAQLERALRESLEPLKTAAVPADNEPRPKLLDDVAILNHDHAIFRLINNAKLRNLAWGALRQMKMRPAIGAAAASADRQKWTVNIIDAALTQSPTPVAAVAFLAKHDEAGVPQALIQFVSRGDNDASKAAAKALYGSGWPLDQIIVPLGTESDRHAFGMRFYENIQSEAPYSVNLLRDKADAASSTGWFARQIANGHLPHPVEWAQPYQGEDKLLLLVNVNDDQLALGAIGTLTALAGGSGADFEDIAKKLRGNKNATIPEITRIWATLRKDLFASRLKRTSGAHQLTIRTGTASRTGEVTWNAARKLGKVTLTVEGDKVTFNDAAGSVPADDSLSLVMKAEDLIALDRTPAAGLAAIKVASDRAIAFTPRGHDGWIASFSTPDATRIEITLVAAQ